MLQYIIAFLYINFFAVGVVNGAEGSKNQVDTLNLIPVIPILKGLVAGMIIFFLGAVPAGMIAGLKFPTTDEIIAFGYIFGALGLFCWWVPLAYIPRTMQGDKFVIKL